MAKIQEIARQAALTKARELIGEDLVDEREVCALANAVAAAVQGEVKKYRPQHTDECEWHLCAGCDSTFRACRIAGACHDARRACNCGLDAMLAAFPPAPAEGGT